MFFTIATVLDFFLTPSNFIGVLVLAGLVALIAQRVWVGSAAMLVAVLMLIILGWSPLGSAMLLPLENRFPAPDLAAPHSVGTVAGIIMLGGAQETEISTARATSSLNEAGERVTATMVLSRRFPDVPVVLSGGDGALAGIGPFSEARIARDILTAMGLDPARIQLEEASRNTFENARESAAILKPVPGQRWLLVTSANHMPRAVGTFRQAGFDVIAVPVDYRTRGAGDLWRPAVSLARGLAAVDVATHEWIGLLVYRILGKSAELFPAP